MSARACGIVVRLVLRRIAVGTLVLGAGRRRWSFGSGLPVARARIHDPRFWPMLLRGSNGLADAYAHGLWDSPDLVALIRWLRADAKPRFVLLPRDEYAAKWMAWNLPPPETAKALLQ